MRLKSLELVGFKSFLGPTTIGFSPGITAVVGPNGCGKSNVVDAIRWVLGEQAPTRLRGKTTGDLIYAGNDSHPAAGMAEVSLILEAGEESPLPEHYSALSEVCVTRRIYRSGDTEYLINKIPCRLKDITEFFMAAQIHSRSYALIEQGRIEEIIQSKPAELRGLVEEAAGLSLFKGRREISERKLERVKENLARVDDVLGEIERQLAFARRQAKKAETYRIIRSELDELERLVAARRLLEENAELNRHSGREAELKSEAESARAHAASLQLQADEGTQALAALRDRLNLAIRELENVRASSAERARTRGFLERRLDTLAGLEPDLDRRLGELESQARISRAARAAAGARFARESNASSDSGESALEELRRRHDGAQKALKESEKRAEDLKDDLSDLVREAAVVRSRLGDLAGERADLEDRLRAGGSDVEALATGIATARDELQALDAELSASRVEVNRLEAREHESTAQELEVRSALEGLSARLAVMREELAILQAPAENPMRPTTAERLRTVLESLNGDRPQPDPPLVTDVIKAPPALEPALGAVLGEQLDAVIVESTQFAVRAIEVLKEKQSGRLSFISQSAATGAAHPAIEAPGIAGRLLDMLEVDPRFTSVAEAIMGHVLVAEDLPSALRASTLNGTGTLFVTRDGDMVWPDLMIRGGSVHRENGAQRDGARLLSVEATMLKVAEAEAERRSLENRLAEKRETHEQIRTMLSEARHGTNSKAQVVGEKRSVLVKLEQRHAIAEASRSDTKRRLAEIADLAAGSNTRLEELALEEQAARARLVPLRNEIAERKAAVEELGSSMLELASKIEARRAKFRELDQELRHLSRITDDLESQIDHNRDAIARSCAERIEFERELAKLAEQDVAAQGREVELDSTVTALRMQCEEGERELESRRADHKRAQEALAAIEQERVECSLRCERARTLSDELARSFAEKFHVDFPAVAAELEAALAQRDTQRDDERLRELRAKAERIGEVNLAAESEVKELEERAAVLEKERSDLEAAVKDLSHTIQKLNREARKRFTETFEGAARNFAELFPKLLRGGKGRLELMEADDVLEAGVNILVQPAGKKVKEIGLLSGGEKALSAMALIFSLFLLNPSPFCVMDEVDAPLDEFSLGAFTSLVNELKQNSQFIVITHNQRTMQRADHIHGVTMEQPGVSRIISLKIPEAA